MVYFTGIANNLPLSGLLIWAKTTKSQKSILSIRNF